MWVTLRRRRACMHETLVLVPKSETATARRHWSRTRIRLTIRRSCMTSSKQDCIERRGRGRAQRKIEAAGKGLARRARSAYLRKRSGDAGTNPDVCDADAGCCSYAGEGPVCFQPKLAGSGWLVHLHPGRHQAKRRRNATTTLGLVHVRVLSGMRS
jgi:hypothetical protein